jgi:aspartate aminotransferase
MAAISRAVEVELAEMAGFLAFLTSSKWAQREGAPGIADFMLGNPHDGVLPAFTDALLAATPPRSPSWHAYKMSEPESCAIVAASLSRQTGVAFEPEDIAMTNGAFTGLAVSLRAVVDPGDEVIYVSPPWFLYRSMIRSAGALPVPATVDPATLAIDPARIEAAVTSRTRAVIVNSPHNPTGKIADEAILADLAERLTRLSNERERPIYLLSDEAYRRVVFDGRECPTAAAFYPRTFLIYTYGKTLLTPGERIGYVAMSPAMPDREFLRPALLIMQAVTGYGFPNAILQHALADLDELTIDVDRLQARRDRLVCALRDAGYDVTMPEGTFYLLCKAPGGDDVAFADRLADDDVFVLPGVHFEMPGYVRFSLTATDEMVEQAIPILQRAIAP